MKAAVLFETGQPLKVIDEIEVPSLQKGQVEVELAYSGVCHSQLMEVRGRRGPDKFLPHLLGHEATGIVSTIGEGVTKVKPGDKVILGWIKGEGLNAPGALYRWQNQILNSGGITTFSDKTVVSENRLTLLPEGLPMDVGVLYGCAIPTGAGLSLNEVSITDESTVVIIGVGGIGAISLMYARCYSPKKLIAIDIQEEKRAKALEMGADIALDGAASNLLEQISDHTDGLGADICLDAAGKTQTIELAFNAVRRNGGKCVFASHPEFGQKISIDPFELINGKSIHGSWGGSTVPDRDIPRYYSLSVEHEIDFRDMLTKRYSLDRVNDALDDLEAGKVLRPILEINPDLG